MFCFQDIGFIGLFKPVTFHHVRLRVYAYIVMLYIINPLYPHPKTGLKELQTSQSRWLFSMLSVKRKPIAVISDYDQISIRLAALYFYFSTIGAACVIFKSHFSNHRLQVSWVSWILYNAACVFWTKYIFHLWRPGLKLYSKQSL